MSSYASDNAEFAVGIIFVVVGACLLYSEYNPGYWGIVALGLIFIVKNWSVTRRVPASSFGPAAKPKGSRPASERINR